MKKRKNDAQRSPAPFALRLWRIRATGRRHTLQLETLENALIRAVVSDNALSRSLLFCPYAAEY